jgi:hypothetical protein
VVTAIFEGIRKVLKNVNDILLLFLNCFQRWNANRFLQNGLQVFFGQSSFGSKMLKHGCQLALRSGADVVISIFCDFANFWQKWRFSKFQIFFAKTSSSLNKKMPICLLIYFAKIFQKS